MTRSGGGGGSILANALRLMSKTLNEIDVSLATTGKNHVRMRSLRSPIVNVMNGFLGLLMLLSASEQKSSEVKCLPVRSSQK